MKKLLLILFLTSFTTLLAQEQTQTENHDQNELRINVTNALIFEWVDLSYERVLNEESTIGLGVLFSLNDDSEVFDEYRTFSLTPYYRHFFSRKYARGFFVEAFGMLHTRNEIDYIYEDFPPYENFEISDKHTDFALGVSGGAKFITKRGFVAEFYFGIGRDLFSDSDIEFVGRGGLSLGFRF